MSHLWHLAQCHVSCTMCMCVAWLCDVRTCATWQYDMFMFVCTKILLESRGYRTRPLKLADIDPRSLTLDLLGKWFNSELMVQIKPKSVYGVENPHPRIFLGGIAPCDGMHEYVFFFCHWLLRVTVQPIASGVSFNLNRQSQSHWSLFNGTWQKRLRELDDRLRFEIEEMTLQIR